MTRLILAGLFAITAFGCHEAAKTDCGGGGSCGRRPLLVNITEGPDDAHEVTMALQLAGHALDQGRTVALFFNIEGVHVPTRSLDATLSHGDKPIKQMLVEAMSRGAVVLVCPHCMKAENITQANLIDGAKMATADSLFGHVDRGAAVFTY